VILRDDHDLCDRFAAEGFTALATDDLHNAIDWLLDYDAVRGDGVGVLAFSASDGVIARPDVQAVVVVDPMAMDDEDRPMQAHETFDDVAWTRTLEFLRAKLG
jgi:dienelactone hydrolase